MRHLIVILTLALAASAATAAAAGKNIGLLVEWIQVDHKSANELLHQFAGEKTATALRVELGKRLDNDQAKLIDTSYLLTRSGMRAKIESLREHIYATEFFPPDIISFVPQKLLGTKYDVSLSALGILASGSANDTRDLGTILEIEPHLSADGRIAFNIAASRSELIVGDPKPALNGRVQPDFRDTKTHTNFIADSGEDLLIDVITPKNDSAQRIFLIIRANALAAKRKPVAGEISFTKKLPAGSLLSVDFHSNGCFHNTSHRYEFEGNQVTIFNLHPKLKKHGTVELTKTDLEKLDKTLAFYRSDPSSGCTTIEEISLTIRRGGKVIAHEKYTDGSCSIDEQLGILTLGEIHSRLK